MPNPIYINADFIDHYTVIPELVGELRKGFAANDIEVPDRHHHQFPNSKLGSDTTMLLMPAWQDGLDGGIKIVTLNPHNSTRDLPTIQGTYLYMDGQTGETKAIIDGKKLTTKRTAAASALASSYLSKTDCETMLMIGTGALSTELVKAHCAIRPIKQAYIWGRNYEKAIKVCEALADEDLECSAVKKIETVINEVDLISAATLSKDPLIYGVKLKSGQHIDLVGSFKPDMREADDDAITKSAVYVDVKHMAIKESGDLYIPMANGIIEERDIIGDLFDLCSGGKSGRISNEQTTLFKSVGHALEDLIAARYYYQKFMDKQHVSK